MDQKGLRYNFHILYIETTLILSKERETNAKTYETLQKKLQYNKK